MLWAAALAVWGRFPLDHIIITGNRAHMFVFLNNEDGHLLNNTKWFSNTRINNQSELSEFVRVVASSTGTTFSTIRNWECVIARRAPRKYRNNALQTFMRISADLFPTR
ncbi:MAG: hypothetical protein H0W58_03665 [Acidobacteria bacterium]|jgi:predicted secreted protein|nr:hypothetical protein [Acidobacteriota bacterium]